MDTEQMTDVVNDHLPEGTRPIRSLANPGEINKQIAAVLIQHVDVNEVGRAIDRLIKKKRTTKFGVEDDARAQEAGVKLFLAYTAGLPIQRSESVVVALDADASVNLEERLRSSPSMRAAMRSMLDKAEGAMEVESVPE